MMLYRRDALIDTLDRVTGRRTLTQLLPANDEEVNHHLVRQLLWRSRFRTWIVTGGKYALERLDQQDTDVVLLDLRVPGMDGNEFLRNLRSDSNRRVGIAPTSAILQPNDCDPPSDAALTMSGAGLSSATAAIENVLPTAETVAAS